MINGRPSSQRAHDTFLGATRRCYGHVSMACSYMSSPCPAGSGICRHQAENPYFLGEYGGRIHCSRSGFVQRRFRALDTTIESAERADMTTIVGTNRHGLLSYYFLLTVSPLRRMDQNIHGAPLQPSVTEQVSPRAGCACTQHERPGCPGLSVMRGFVALLAARRWLAEARERVEVAHERVASDVR